MASPSDQLPHVAPAAIPPRERAMRKSHQIRALGRKAVSFQKRQVFTNVCCISLCPLFMIVISAGLGALITSLIQKTTTIEDILYCSNVYANDSFGFPIFNTSDTNLYGANTPNGKQTNSFTYLNLAGATNNPGAALLTISHPCSFWFGEDFPAFSPYYERNANLTGLAKADSTFTDPPDGGWMKVFKNYTMAVATKNPVDPALGALVQTFTGLQQGQWVLYGSRPELANILGARPQQPIVPVDGLSNLAGALDGQVTTFANYTNNTASGSYGLLGTLETRYFYNSTVDSNGATIFRGLSPVPYYVPVFPNNTATDLDLDTELANRLNALIVALAGLDKTPLTKSGQSNENVTKFMLQAAATTSVMPYGALFLDAYDAAALSARVIMHFGSDLRLSAAANFPSQGNRQMVQLTQLSQALLRSFNASLGGATITQGLRSFPYVHNTKLYFPFGGLIGGILYPFGVSFLLPIFVIILVKEKEDRILMMMRMNGMKSWAYFLSHYVTFFILFVVSSLIFLIAGRLSQLEFFTNTQLGVIILLFFVWGNVQIALAFFFTSIFNKNRTALVLVFLLVLCGVIISLVFESLFDSGTGATVPVYIFIWPPFAFYRALNNINVASYNALLVPYSLDMVKPGDEVFTALIFMILSIPVYLALAFYLSSVLPVEFGVRKAWHFPISEPIRAMQRNARKKANGGIDPLSESNLAASVKIDENETQFEDADVKAERARIDSGSYPPNSPIVVSHMRKVYGSRRGLGPKLAVKDVTFAAEEGLIFGLLGPNGAGKTTLISILTGLYEASSGNAQLAGFNYKTESDSVYKVIGVCPQFDILWDELTVGEHLYFYARLKGIDAKDEKECVRKALANVSLSSLETRLTKGLSGGEKRRLSIAIALIGDPSVVFLDEPTTGLDPEVRRLIWNIITFAREGKTIILTTHSMEEAEALCQRIGIMAKGTLRCCANPLRLKELYGSGFKLFFNADEDNTEQACNWIESLLPEGWTRVDSFATNVSYEFPTGPGVISRLFTTIEAGKAQNGVLDWGISQTTLEEVFLKIISDDDANAD
ncbi:hypothetical protein HK101_009969 [Irineochytrium annulatum]|nr:hypothetical protein HK101_009969 [Irineochytrium annulatum]